MTHDGPPPKLYYATPDPPVRVAQSIGLMPGTLFGLALACLLLLLVILAVNAVLRSIWL